MRNVGLAGVFSILTLLSWFSLAVCVRAQGPGYGNAQQRQQMPRAQPWQRSGAPLIQQVQSGSPRDWFAFYDQLRDRTLLSEEEGQRADNLLDNLDHAITRDDADFIQDLISRFQYDCNVLQSVRPISETERLQRGFYNYACESRDMYTDFLRWQELPIPTRRATFDRFAQAITQHRQSLARLERSNGLLDEQIRAACGVPPDQTQEEEEPPKLLGPPQQQ